MLKKHYIVFFLCFLFACGYKFVGSGTLPNGVKTIFVSIFENRTSEVGIENKITNYLTNQLALRNENADKEKAAAILSGIVHSITVGTVAYQGKYTPTERRVTIIFDLKLTDNQGKVIWSRNGISDNEQYNVSSDTTSTETNKRKAISILSERVAEKAYNLMTDNF